MILMSWFDLFRFSAKRAMRKPAERQATAHLAGAVRLEVLEDRALLSAVSFDSATQQLSLNANAGANDNVQISQLDASRILFQVAPGDVLTLHGDAVNNPDFELIDQTTLLVHVSTGHAPVRLLSLDLGDGTNQLSVSNLTLEGFTAFQAGTVQLGEISVGAGGLTVTGQQITSNGLINGTDGGGVTLIASGAFDTANDNLVINAGIQSTGSTPAGNGGTIYLAAGNNLLINSAELTTVGDGEVKALAGFTRPSGQLTMTGTASIRSEGGQISLATQGTGTLTALSLSTNSPALLLASSLGNVVVDGPIQNTSGKISVSAGSDIVIHNTVNATGSGDVILTADADATATGEVQLGSSARVLAGQGNIAISGVDVDCGTGVLVAEEGYVQLKPSVPGADVNLGTDILFGLTDSDLQQVTASELRIGSLQAGLIVVTASLQDLPTSVLRFESSGGVTQTFGATLDVSSLGIRSLGAVQLEEANRIGNFAADLSGGSVGQSVSVTNALNLTVGQVGEIEGVRTNSGSVSLQLAEANGLLTIAQPIATGTAGLVSFDADDVALNATVNVGQGQVLIRPKSAGRSVDLGTNSAGNLGLTHTELGHITAGALVIGAAVPSLAGIVVVSAPVALPGVSTLEILNVTSLRDENETGIDLTVQALLLQLQNGIASSGMFSTAVSRLEGSTVEGDLAMENTGDLTIGGVANSLHGLTVQNSGSIRLRNHGTLTLSESGAASLNAGSSDGDIFVETVGADADIMSVANSDLAIALAGDISLIAGRDFQSGAGGTSWDGDLEADGSITLQAGRDVLLSGDADLRADNFGNGTGGGVAVTAGRNVILQGSQGTTEIPSLEANGFEGGDVVITTGPLGTLSLTTDGLAANSAMLATASGNLTLISDHLVISGYALLNSAGSANIIPRSSERKVNLGSTTDVSSDSLELSNSELNHIAARILRIGSSQAADIGLTTDITLNPANVPVLSLISGGHVYDNGVANLDVGKLRVSAQGNILLDDEGHRFNTIALQSAEGDISVMATYDLVVGSVDGVDGIRTGNGSLAVGSSEGLLTILNTPAEHDLDAGSGDVAFGSFSLEGIIVASGADVRGLGGVLVVGNQQRLDGTITATGGRVALETAGPISQFSPAIPIDLGGDDSSAHLGLSDEELDRIDAATIEIGTYTPSANPVIRVTSVISPLKATTLALNGAEIVQAGGLIQSPNLALLAVNGIGTNTPVLTDVSMMAFYNQTTGDVNIRNAGALTLGGISGFNGSANLAGAVILTTKGPLTVASGVLAAHDINLVAEESLKLNNHLTVVPDTLIVSLTGNVSLSAGDTLEQKGTVAVQVAGATITLTGGKDDLDDFGAVILNGPLTTYDTVPELRGGSGADTITVNQNSGITIGGGTVGLKLQGGAGNDTYQLNFDQGLFDRSVSIDDVSGAQDQLEIQGLMTNDTVAYDSRVSPTIHINNKLVAFSGLENVDMDAGQGMADVLNLAENVPGFHPASDTFVETAVPLTFQNFETVTIPNTLPTVENLSASASNEGGVTTLTGSFTDAERHLGEIFLVLIDWGDGSPQQSVAVPYTSGNQEFTVTHVYADDNPSGTGQDDFLITVTISDDNGGLSATPATVTARVTNVVPSLADATLTSVVAENGFATLAGTIVDAGVLDSHTLEIDWGDGSPIQTVAVSGNEYSVTHQYLDDGPSNSTADNYTVTVTVKDDDSGSLTVSGPITIVNVAPTIDSVQLSATDIDENGTVTVSGTYSDVGSLDTHTLRINWGDNSGIQSIQISGGVFSVSHQYLDDKPLSVGIDTMYINLVVVDDDLGMIVNSKSVEVHNTAPTTEIAGAPATSPEGTLISVTSLTLEPGTLDVLTYRWSVTRNGQPYLTATTPNLTFTPNDAGDYAISLQVADDDGGAADVATKSISVTEVAPIAGVSGPQTVVLSTPVPFTLQAADPSTVDQNADFTFDIDWNGDGTVDETIEGPSGTVVSHTFQIPGPVAIKVTATDRDGTVSDMVQTLVNVVEFQLQDSILSVGGTAGADRIRVKDLGSGNVEVFLNSISRGRFTPHLIRIYGGEGNDRILVDSTVRVPVELFGGAGDDWLAGGKGNDLVDGGAGDDQLEGRRGNDVLLGGIGNDRLEAGSGRDLVIGGLGSDRINQAGSDAVLIGGTTGHDSSKADLFALRDEWAASGTIDQRLAHLKNGGGLNGAVTLKPGIDAPDDGAEDKLYGDRGSNWFISFVTDRISGRTRRSNRSN